MLAGSGCSRVLFASNALDRRMPQRGGAPQLIKIGAQVVSHGRYAALQTAFIHELGSIRLI
jgi:hypothetical protein